jgi:hypothetical protein
MMFLATILLLTSGTAAHTISSSNGPSALLRLRGGKVDARLRGGQSLATKSEAELKPVTEKEILEVQKKWANAITTISAVHKAGGDYIGEAAKAAGELYAYEFGDVLFKPTKAREVQFRPTAGEAMSYFVGGDVVDKGYKEDKGFAINGGKGHKKCVYKNHKIIVTNGVGIAMGTYDFTCATTGNVDSVEYTFGYMRCPDGKVRIFLHHSSLPYSPH